jgi:hypothetical protein
MSVNPRSCQLCGSAAVSPESVRKHPETAHPAPPPPLQSSRHGHPNPKNLAFSPLAPICIWLCARVHSRFAASSTSYESGAGRSVLTKSAQNRGSGRVTTDFGSISD